MLEPPVKKDGACLRYALMFWRIVEITGPRSESQLLWFSGAFGFCAEVHLKLPISILWSAFSLFCWFSGAVVPAADPPNQWKLHSRPIAAPQIWW